MEFHPQLALQADAIYSKCGRPMAPPGLTIIPLYFGILVQGNVANNATNVITKEIPGDLPFFLRCIQASNQPNAYILIQLPSGRYLMNFEQLETRFNGIGSYRYELAEELECPPGSKIILTMDTSPLSPGATENVSMLFEGYYRAVVKSSAPKKDYRLASSEPRYENESNIMAPAWMQGLYPDAPCPEEDFIYGDNNTNVLTFAVATGPYSGSLVIPLDLGFDFAHRRVLVDVTRDNTAVGTVLGRLRAGSGYAWCDDLMNIELLPNGSFCAHDWNIRAGDKVVCDLQLVDFSGTGNIRVEVFLDGVRRKVT